MLEEVRHHFADGRQVVGQVLLRLDEGVDFLLDGIAELRAGFVLRVERRLALLVVALLFGWHLGLIFYL